MTREEFIQELDNRNYSYNIEGDKIVVTDKGFVDLRSLTSLPPEVVFNNEGFVDLRSLKILPPGVVFNNRGSVSLRSLTSLPPGVQFNNLGTVNLRLMIRGWFNEWKGNIEGVDSKRLLNFMISKGIFQK